MTTQQMAVSQLFKNISILYCSKGSLLYFIISWYCPNIYI